MASDVEVARAAARQRAHAYNQRIVRALREGGGRIGDGSLIDNGHLVLLLHTTGSRSARGHLTPLYYTVDGGGDGVDGGHGHGRIVVVAARGGMDSNPDWYFNLLATPRVVAEVGAERAEFIARPVTDPAERDRLFRRHADQHPVFDDFARRTRRRFPVIVLERADRPAPG
ncbi:nitroreductase/quinone reductase family protein [Streptomyces sp. 6N223]|uniref:nitroreductase/quinone reductase family protein n=1 Tax=Streptomyces sp. 6N223 TaxID=3457412 RepID=UPI003FD23046